MVLILVIKSKQLNGSKIIMPFIVGKQTILKLTSHDKFLHHSVYRQRSCKKVYRINNNHMYLLLYGG